ncbi:hypothetical protein Scep_022403 [Stephania cephalantha]|uniref:Uncharacterized protein n=1 Tax=Stephania cephalantha TaxID=152367 RepID=A0AAP0F635_9MAGN
MQRRWRPPQPRVDSTMCEIEDDEFDTISIDNVELEGDGNARNNKKKSKRKRTSAGVASLRIGRSSGPR